MRRTCKQCYAGYDDAVATTICPHPRFLTDEECQQKDLAYSLIGRDLHMNHQPDGPIFRVRSVNAVGMVTVYDTATGEEFGGGGEFAPHLFTVQGVVNVKKPLQRFDLAMCEGEEDTLP